MTDDLLHQRADARRDMITFSAVVVGASAGGTSRAMAGDRRRFPRTHHRSIAITAARPAGLQVSGAVRPARPMS
ncbi:MAG TPA: hypothetical protein VF755_19645 [Catenuloplanes sp.]|jgi:hypothetical protein